MSGDGDVDQFPCIFLCGTLPSVELRTHIPPPGGLGSEHPCLLPATPDASDASDVIQRCPSQAPVIQWIEIVGHTKRLMHTTSFCP